MSLKEWLRYEWERAELTLAQANEACGVKSAASRKYLSQDHLWYWPPVEMFAKLRDYAQVHGSIAAGDPYGPAFSLDGVRPLTNEEWAATRPKFRCPHGVTNVWDRPPLSGAERVRVPGDRTAGRAAHLNQKPLDLVERTVVASSDVGDVVWEPFGGLFTATLAALGTGRRAFAGELDPVYFELGVGRLRGVAGARAQA
jgi:site-specific DNA-methyltransferase (adenine-specific)